MNEIQDSEKKLRLFIGINFPSEVKSKIAEFLQPIQLSPKGWVSPHDYHQTLLFIGETPESKVEEIKTRLNQISFSKFVLETLEFKFFNRRIMYLDFMPSADLIILAQKVQELFPEYVREYEKDFLPHITVKRWQRYEYDHLVEGLRGRALRPLQVLVNSVSLFKSERDLVGNKYHIIHQVNFEEK
jgi:2'-5' RNA ligase